MGKHPSHDTRISDASTFDEICVYCGATDQVPGGWGRLADPCPKTPTHPQRRRVYIAGPISKGPLDANIAQAERAFYRLLKAGFTPFCPHWRCYGSGPQRDEFGNVYAVALALPAGTTHEDWMGADLPWVEVADAVLRLPGESRGADAEEFHAAVRNIPIFHSVEDLIRAFDADLPK